MFLRFKHNYFDADRKQLRLRHYSLHVVVVLLHQHVLRSLKLCIYFLYLLVPLRMRLRINIFLLDFLDRFIFLFGNLLLVILELDDGVFEIEREDVFESISDSLILGIDLAADSFLRETIIIIFQLLLLLVFQLDQQILQSEIAHGFVLCRLDYGVAYGALVLQVHHFVNAGLAISVSALRHRGLSQFAHANWAVELLQDRVNFNLNFL